VNNLFSALLDKYGRRRPWLTFAVCLLLGVAAVVTLLLATDAPVVLYRAF